MTTARIHPRTNKRGTTYSVTVGDNPERTVAKGIKSRRRAERIRKLVLKEAELEAELLPVSASTTTVGRALDLYLNMRSDKRSLKSMEARTRLHLRPDLEDVLLADLTVAKVEQLLAKLSRTKSPQTVKHVKAHLSGAITEAIRAELFAGANVARLAKLPVALPETGQNDWLRPEEWEPFLAAVPPRWRNFFGLALTTGMRCGEVAGACRVDVDLEGRRMHVRRSWGNDTTKNGGTRWIPLSSLAMVHAQEAMLRAGTARRLFPGSSDGMVPRHTKWSILTRNAAAAAGLVEGYTFVCRRKGCGYSREAKTRPLAMPDCPTCGFRLWPKAHKRPLRFHDLRHSFASSLALSGVDYLTIARLIGDDPEQVRRRYAHLTPGHFDDAVAKAVELVRKSKPSSTTGKRERK